MANILIPPRIATLVGTITAINAPVQFSLPERNEGIAQKATISVQGGGVTTPTWELDCSIDGGVSWFAVTPTTFTLTGLMTGDTAATYAASFQTNGLVSALFKFGLTAGTAITSMAVYVLAN